MNTSTEEKLNTLKVINTEKDSIDQALERLADETRYTGVRLEILSGKPQEPFVVPLDVCNQVVDLLTQFYITRRAELITKANEIMKSE